MRGSTYGSCPPRSYLGTRNAGVDLGHDFLDRELAMRHALQGRDHGRAGLKPLELLARHGVAHLAVIDPITGERVRSSRRSNNRYEHREPGR